METCSKRKMLSYAFSYCCIALLIHYPVVASYFDMPAGSEILLASTALTSTNLQLQIVTYVLTVFLINLLPLVPLLTSLRNLDPFLRRHGFTPFTAFLLAVFCFWTAVLCLNKVYFPQSSFGLLLPIENPMTLRWLGFSALTLFLALGFVPALWAATKYLGSQLHRPVARIALGVSLATGLIQPLYSHWSNQGASSSRPDVIFIGIDSATWLHLQHHPNALPHLRKLLSQSTVYTNTITPLARTFPAWTSILTAQYPVHTGARFNLTAFDQVNTRVTLPKILKAQGYTTIYAQDERTFNNLDESFGFDKVVGPKVGAAEFVLTKISDHPLENLALLTSWGKQLFPFIALNRADSIHYDPDEFIAAVIDNLPRDRGHPLFLATHFCLAHYPYTWRTQSRQNDAGASQSIDEQHIAALGVLEHQITQLLQALKQQGRLENTILVLLSDHGESLNYSDGHWVSLDKQKNKSDTYEKKGYLAFNTEGGYSGHGSDVLARIQYQSLLAFQGFGSMRAAFTPRSDDRISSLVDIMPTILATLRQPVPPNLDGINLLAAAPVRNTRTVTAETGLRFASLSSIAKFSETSLLKESHNYYRLEPASARLTLKKAVYPELIASKDVAVHTDDWMLALLRKNGNPYFPRVAVLINKPSGAWTLGHDKALIQRAPMAALTRGLRQAYGREIADFESSWAFNQKIEVRQVFNHKPITSSPS